MGWVLNETQDDLSMNEDHDFQSSESKPARAVDYFIHDNDLYVVVGCHEDWDIKEWEDGWLYLYKITENEGTYQCDCVGEEYVEGGIFSVDATTALQKSPGEEASVFVAATKYGVKRYMIDLDQSDPNDKFVYQAMYPDPTPLDYFFARDLVLDEPADPEVDPANLYVACYEDLVLVFDVRAPASLIPPEDNIYWQKASGKAAHALDLLKEQGEPPRLFVAFGPSFKAEYQYWGIKDLPVPPKGSNNVATGGLNVYNVSNPLRPILLGYMSPSDAHPGGFNKEPVDVSALPMNTPEVDVGFMAMDTKGLGRMIMDTYASGPHVGEYQLVGRFDNSNDDDDPVPLGAIDDCLIQGNYLYTASEGGVQVYDWSSGGLENMVGWGFNNSAILFSSRPGMLYGATQAGVAFWDITNPIEPVGNGYLYWNVDDTDRTGFCFAKEYGNYRFLYVTQFKRKQIEGSFTIHLVNDFSYPSECECLRRFNGSAEGDAPGNYIDVAVVGYASDQIAYVSFGPSIGIGDVAGIHYFRIKVLLSYPPSTPVIQPIIYLGTKTIQAPHGIGGRLKLLGNRLYSAFGPGGIAVYGIQDPTNPSVVGERVIELYNEPLSALQIQPFTYGAKTLAYVTLLSGHLAVVDVTDGNTMAGPYDLYETRFQTTSVIFDPLYPSDAKKLILTDARGGVHRVEVPTLPGD